MLDMKPSNTARLVAALRAEHQELDGGKVFADPLAARILGEDLAVLMREFPGSPGQFRGIRLLVAARSRIAEDALAAAVRAGTRQAVVLGAGLDTLGCRNPFAADGLRVIEVDHPATQAWKRHRLTEAGIPVPPSLTFAPADFEHASLGDVLAAAGLDPAQPAFFIWLGVTMYLTREAISATLGYIAGLPGGAEAVFDYLLPPAALPPREREFLEQRSRHVAAAGEQFRTQFAPGEVAAEATRLGFSEFDDIDPNEVVSRLTGEPVRLVVERRVARARSTGRHMARVRSTPARQQAS